MVIHTEALLPIPAVQLVANLRDLSHPQTLPLSDRTKENTTSIPKDFTTAPLPFSHASYFSGCPCSGSIFGWGLRELPFDLFLILSGSSQLVDLLLQLFHLEAQLLNDFAALGRPED